MHFFCALAAVFRSLIEGEYHIGSILQGSYDLRDDSCQAFIVPYHSVKAVDYSCNYLFQSCKSSLQILDDIVDMLSTDGKTDRVLLDALICKLLIV